MKYFTATLILSFIGVAVFGILLAHPASSHGLTSCLASLVQGKICPPVNNVLATVNFHFDAVKTFVSNTLVLALVLLAAAIFTGFSFAPLPAAAPRQIRVLKFNSASANRRFTRWLSLHENSPSVF